MPTEKVDQPFDSIESAQDFVNVLAETVLETAKELDRDRRIAARDGEKRREQAIELALFKLKMLNCYLGKSRRQLNDLRMLRRLILNERLSVQQVIGSI